MADLKIGSKGSKVTQVQEALVAHGYSLPKWGVDGQLGGETWSALVAFAHDRALQDEWPEAEAWTGAVPGVVLEALLAPTAEDGPPKLIDLTRLHRLEKGRPGLRSPGNVTGIVLHQTATRLGSKPTRWYNVACHVAIPPSGDILYVNDILAYVWHANAANRFTVGIEIDGRFEGIKGKISTLWRGSKGRKPDPLSSRQITAAREAVRWLVTRGRELGCPMTHIYAHRQFSNQRRSDPGSEVWDEIGLWAQREFGLKAPSDYTLGTGLAIPRAWDTSSTAAY